LERLEKIGYRWRWATGNIAVLKKIETLTFVKSNAIKIDP
jgi:hypothetical protein